MWWVLVWIQAASPDLSKPLRLIDSVIFPDITTSERANKKVRTTRAFKVQIARPELMTPTGKKLLHGFDTWYLYVVRATDIRIEGAPLRNNTLPTYLAIISDIPRNPSLPEVFESPALMIKGIVDYGDTFPRYLKRETKRLKGVLDSLALLPVPFDPEEAERFDRLVQKTHDSLTSAQVYYRLYRTFRRVKNNPAALIGFFLSFPFNRSLNYSIYSDPYALPQFRLEKTQQPLQEKHRIQ
ncbi:MAG: hypothetical protein ACUVRD_05430 [Bacteroidia bacterium]